MDKKVEKFLISVGGSEDASDTETARVKQMIRTQIMMIPMKLNEQIKI